jgi:hypothetical protein
MHGPLSKATETTAKRVQAEQVIAGNSMNIRQTLDYIVAQYETQKAKEK